MDRPFDTPPQDDPDAQLERALIEEYLHDRHLSLASLRSLPADEAAAVLKQASLYASGRLSEVESRAHLVDELHHGHVPQEREPSALAGTDAAGAAVKPPAPTRAKPSDTPAPARRRPLKWL